MFDAQPLSEVDGLHTFDSDGEPVSTLPFVTDRAKAKEMICKTVLHTPNIARWVLSNGGSLRAAWERTGDASFRTCP